MGLSEAIARTAVRHAHALLVEVPGAWRTRVEAERAVLARGWRPAISAADADVLVVCGEAGPRLAESVELVWHQMPGPRVRVDVRRYDDAQAGLEQADAALLDTAQHRHDAHGRPTAPDLLEEGEEDDGEDHEGMDHGGHEGMDHGGHEGMDHGGHEGMDHGGHEGMDHGDMEMSPGGIPLAEGGEDRDGLEMDVLAVRLGPVLPHWPAGLVLHCSLQGDVIVEAHAELLDDPGHRDDEDGVGLARRLDAIVSLLMLAGWEDAAAEARRLRDLALDGSEEQALDGLARLGRRVRRSRTLRWSLRGLGRVGQEEARRLGLPASLAGDGYDRFLHLLERAAAADADGVVDEPALSTDQLAGLVAGLDLATARLVIAGLDGHGLRAGHAEHEVAHG